MLSHQFSSLLIRVPSLSILRRAQIIVPGGITRCSFIWWAFIFRAYFRDIFRSSETFFWKICFSSSPLVWLYLVPLWPNTCSFPSLHVFFFSDLALLFLRLFLFSHFFIISKVHFSLPNSIPISWPYILRVCISVASSFSFILTILSY